MTLDNPEKDHLASLRSRVRSRRGHNHSPSCRVRGNHRYCRDQDSPPRRSPSPLDKFRPLAFPSLRQRLYHKATRLGVNFLPLRFPRTLRLSLSLLLLVLLLSLLAPLLASLLG